MTRIVIAKATTGEQTEVDQATFNAGYFPGWVYVKDASGGPSTNPLTPLAVDMDQVLGDPTSAPSVRLRAAYVALGQLAASPDLIAVGTITRSATGAATGFGVVWPDGATGAYVGIESTVAPGAIDSYTVTHVAGGTTATYTQPALTRDSSGNVTARPAMTVA